jgi:pyruvate, orthophosphate dikinase
LAYTVLAAGKIALDSASAEATAATASDVILVLEDTSTDDVRGMHAAAGVLTQQGGMAAHAGKVARNWGKPCVSGCSGLVISMAERTVACGGVTLREGDTVTLDGATGASPCHPSD